MTDLLEPCSVSSRNSTSCPPQIGSGENSRASTLTPLLSDETTDMILFVNMGILSPIISTFGLFSNVINFVIFVRIGFQDTVNISLCSLALSDFFSVVFLLASNICSNPAMEATGIHPIYLMAYFRKLGNVHMAFTRISGLLTAYIAFERCLCVAIPLKVRIILTRNRTFGVMAFIFALAICATTPNIVSNYVSTYEDPLLNTTVYFVAWLDDWATMQSFFFTANNVLGPFSFVAVAICTIILIKTLKDKDKWRQEAAVGSTSSSQEGKNLGSSSQERNRQVVLTVTIISIIFIVCSSLLIMAFIGSTIEPELTLYGVYKNLDIVLLSFVAVLHAINGSVNIFIYVRMSSKYRTIFRSGLSCLSRK